MDSHSVGQVPETGIANVTSHCLRSLLSQVVGNPVTKKNGAAESPGADGRRVPRKDFSDNGRVHGNSPDD